MQNTEIRIGNIVRYENEDVTIAGISGENVRISGDRVVELAAIKGIEFTADYARALGFRECCEVFYYEQYLAVKQGVNGRFFVLFPNTKKHAAFGLRVHEVQNLLKSLV